MDKHTFRVFYIRDEHTRDSFTLGREELTRHDLEKYRPVTQFQSTDLDTVWREMNVVDGSDIERPRKLRVRSMMVGDVVLHLGELKGYVVAPCGFTPLSDKMYGLFQTRYPFTDSE